MPNQRETIDHVQDPQRAAFYASAVLSADYGIPNTIRTIPGGYVVEWEYGSAKFIDVQVN